MSLCILNVVNKPYQKYIPYFLYFCTRTYPEYAVRIILTDDIQDKYKELFEIFLTMGDIKYIIQKSNFRGHELKTLRWLQDERFFDGYENGYIGDIDIILCKEDISLENQHLNHCRDTGLCYSNSVRPNSKRLSGLHFFKVKEYYEKMNDIIYKYKNLLFENKLRHGKNEEILYNMILESGIGFSNYWFRPHHGLHLRLWLKEKPNLSNVLKDDDYKKYFDYFLKMEKDSLYQKINKLIPLAEIKNMKMFDWS